jgi:tetratricopeptide (TPR) repeat protein
MRSYRIANEKIKRGYDYLVTNKAQRACDIWLEAWEEIKSILADTGLKDINELQDKYNWSEFLSNYVQDLEEELHNAGLEDKEYFRKRIKYCEEMLEVCGEESMLLIENTRRAIAESHFELGNEEECDRLFSMWLESDPDWCWGYIGWSDCYFFKKERTDADLEKAETIIAKALSQKGIRDRLYVVERAEEIYRAMGNNEKAAELEKEMTELKKKMTEAEEEGIIELEKSITAGPIKAEKIGRNSPCPCGSGKKYKKCCGKW